MFLKCKIGKFRLYLTDVALRQRQCREHTTKEARRAFFENVRKPVYDMKGGRCEHCGTDKGLEIHHVLPYARFPQLENELGNMMLLCHDCHRRLHQNPFLESKLIRKKAKELKVDYRLVYGNPPMMGLLGK